MVLSISVPMTKLHSPKYTVWLLSPQPWLQLGVSWATSENTKAWILVSFIRDMAWASEIFKVQVIQTCSWGWQPAYRVWSDPNIVWADRWLHQSAHPHLTPNPLLWLLLWRLGELWMYYCALNIRIEWALVLNMPCTDLSLNQFISFHFGKCVH